MLKGLLKSFASATSNLQAFGGAKLLKVKKYAPEIELVGGIIFGGIALVACAKATMKADEVLKEHESMMERVKEAEEVASESESEEYSKEDAAMDKKIAFSKTALRLTKLYLPTVALFTASVSLTVLSHKTMKKRYDGLVIAFNAVNGAFMTYRQRVKKSLGDEADRMFMFDAKYETKKEDATDADGKKHKKSVVVENIEGQSPYAVIFGEKRPDGLLNPNWIPHADTCLAFLEAQERYANHRLQSVGHVFLNEVYDLIGLPHTQAGALVGWVKGNGDDYISFGINKPENVRRTFRDKDYEIMLDFNVDGVVFDLI